MPNPVHYAEQNLEVHKVWAEARDGMTSLEKSLKAEVDTAQQIRLTKDQLVDREHQVVTGARPAFTELSDTAWQKKAKELIHDDPESQRLRQQLREQEAAHDQAQAEVKYYTTDCQMYAARMHELAGLLNFYAATKLAQVGDQAVPLL